MINMLQRKFSSQLVVNPTRARGLDEPHTLDLVITDDSAALDNIELLNPLGNSDHAVLKIKCNVQASTDTAEDKFIFNKVTSLS